ncbi:MAG: hypothetical protein Q8942_16585, partial [Bacillota bacterium]|nr:hypothetical protein [Bacillota bacterium]
MERSIMLPDFHKQLFEKFNIYSYTQEQIKESLKKININHTNQDANSSDQYEVLFLLLQKSTTPEFVKMNIDNLSNGLFYYFNGKRIFLPDINLNNIDSSIGDTRSQSSDENQKFTYALSKINKINLSLALQYFDRNDIIDRLSAIKLCFYLIKIIPGFLILAVSLFVIIAAIISKSALGLIKWVAISFLFCAGLLFAGALILLLLNFTLKDHLYPIISSIPLPVDTSISYLKYCINNISSFLAILGVIMASLSIILIFLIKININNSNRKEKNIIKNIKLTNSIKYGGCALLLMIVISVLFYRSYIVKKEFLENNFPTTIARLRNSTPVTKIIPAKDTTIYSLSVKLTDKNDNSPIPDIQMNLTGETIKGKNYNVTIKSDNNGDAKLTLDKGNFRLSFISNSFPSTFQIPSPMYFELKSAGTTILSIELERTSDQNNQKWGIAEVEVFDKDNKPFPNVELNVGDNLSAPGNPDRLIAVTNSEGIAVFRLYEGSYKIGFSTAKLPKNLIPPSPFETKVIANS